MLFIVAVVAGAVGPQGIWELLEGGVGSAGVAADARAACRAV